MSLSTHLLHTIHRIAEELSPEECKRLSYLCREFQSERCSAGVKEILQSCLIRMNTNQVFLMELMLRMKRYDLLSEVLGISKAEAERLLENSHKLSDYRVLMSDLSEDVGSEDLDSLVFLLRGTLPKEKVEKFECFLDVVVELEKLDQISSTRVDMMEKYLRSIQRVDLAKRLSQYQSRDRTQRPCAVRTRDERRPCNAAPPHASTALKPSAYGNTPVPQLVSPRRPCEWQEEVYRMRSDPRGVCVIIDCVGNEGDDLRSLFLSLHFRVILYKLLSIEDVELHLQDIATQTDHCRMDAFVCCIISRSHSSRLLATDSSGPGLRLDRVRQSFTQETCTGLTGKPKLFFLQGYEVSPSPEFSELQDYGEGELETDSPAHYYREAVPKDADVFWSHCWTNEKQLEGNNHRSVYLQSLKKTLTEGQKGRLHLVDLHTLVNRDVYAHNSRHPESAYHIDLKHTLRKNLYLT